MSRIQVYTDSDLKRRIKLAAAKQDVTITQYCLEAIQERLQEEEILEQDSIEVKINPQPDDDLFLELRALREKILVRREGKLISRDVLTELREERDNELSGLY